MSSAEAAAAIDDRLYPARPILAASCAVVRDGRVLIAMRTRPPRARVWSLPGGLVEAGELLEDAARRELMEEVGVAASVEGFIRHVQHIERDEGHAPSGLGGADGLGAVRHHFVIAAFAARWVSGEGSTSDEAAEVAWATPEEAERLVTTDGLPAIMARALEMLRA